MQKLRIEYYCLLCVVTSNLSIQIRTMKFMTVYLS